MVELYPAHRKKAVPEQRDLLLQVLGAGRQAPGPLRVGVPDRPGLGGGDEIAFEQILVLGLTVLRVEQFFDRLLVTLGQVAVYLVSRRSESGPAEQVSRKGCLSVRRNGGRHGIPPGAACPGAKVCGLLLWARLLTVLSVGL